MSFPHFYAADETYQTAISGLDPTNEKYRTVVDVEPVSNPYESCKNVSARGMGVEGRYTHAFLSPRHSFQIGLCVTSTIK